MTVEEMYQIGSDGTITTKTGKINVFDPQPEDIKIEDIAWALSFHVTRWLGRGTQFFPVAQHCCEAYHLVQEEHKLAALLHDSSEAYLLDIPKPIKERMPEYKSVEDRLMLAIADKFNFQYPLSPEVKRVDKHLLEHEWNDYIVSGKKIIWSPSYAHHHFLKNFHQ